MRSMLFCGCIAAFVSACGGNTTPIGPTDLRGSTWQLISLQENGAAPVTIDDSSKYTVRFEDDGRLSVRSDCNSCGGSYTQSGSTLAVDGLTCTLIACPTGTLDRPFAQGLEGAQTAAVSDSQLTIRGGGVTLQFRR